MPSTAGRIVPNHAMGGAQSLAVTVGFDGSMNAFRAQVRDENGQMIAQGFEQYDRTVLPSSVRRINSDPRRMR